MDEKIQETGRFEIKIRVRWNEMDANGHVNNMYYQSYFDEARGDAFTKAGMDLSMLRRKMTGPLLYRCEFDYIRELRHPDSARIVTWVDIVSDKEAVVNQELFRESDGKLVCRAKGYGMFYDFKNREAVSFPEDVVKRLANEQ